MQYYPFKKKVYFGTTAGQLIVMDVHGAMVSEVQLAAGITSMVWNAEKFTMEEGNDDVTSDPSQKGIVIAIFRTNLRN